jgi:hypothetical protein
VGVDHVYLSRVRCPTWSLQKKLFVGNGIPMGYPLESHKASRSSSCQQGWTKYATWTGLGSIEREADFRAGIVGHWWAAPHARPTSQRASPSSTRPPWEHARRRGSRCRNRSPLRQQAAEMLTCCRVVTDVEGTRRPPTTLRHASRVTVARQAGLLKAEVHMPGALV